MGKHPKTYITSLQNNISPKIKSMTGNSVPRDCDKSHPIKKHVDERQLLPINHDKEY